MSEPQTASYAFQEGEASRYLGSSIEGYSDPGLQLEFAAGWSREDARLQKVEFWLHCLRCGADFPVADQEARRKAPRPSSQEIPCPTCAGDVVTMFEQGIGEGNATTRGEEHT